MMIALSDFWLLHGFKTKQAMLATLNARPSLQGLATKLVQQDMHAFMLTLCKQIKNSYLNGYCRL